MGSISGALEVLLSDILSVIKPFDDDVRTRHLVINEFRSVVASVESLRGATVEPFGSFIANLYTRWGDLDISIEVPSDSLVSSIGRKRKQNLLRDLMKALRKRGVAHNIQFIPNARVPLLIFESNYRSISCDISISNLAGQIKSKFFFWITEIDERFRHMVLLVKEWAKSQDINNPKTGTLNSYSLSLLVIFHFQTCQPPILPPLQEIYEGNIVDELKGERDIQDICTANIARFRTNNMGYSNKSTLAELFVSFFDKFSRIYTMASEYAICTYTGKWENIRSNSKWTAKAYSLIIEDPFDQADNAARAVGKNQLVVISEAFERTSRKLSSNQEQGSLITSLIRPQIRSQLTARSQANQNAGSGGYRHPSHFASTSRPIQNQYHSPNGFPHRQQFFDPMHPISGQLQNVRLDPPASPSPSISSQRRPFSSTVRPIQNQYVNRRVETTSETRPFSSTVRPIQSQYENRQMETSPTPNNYSLRSAQAVPGQGSQVWRPRQAERR